MPAFPAIYGGYYVGFGSIYNAADFAQPDVAAARMAMTFVCGAQIGWFSLGGVTYGPDLDLYCGPMGTYDFWASDEAAPIVAYLTLLANYRTAAIDYFVSGRMLMPLTFGIAPSTFTLNANASYNFGYDTRLLQ